MYVYSYDMKYVCSIPRNKLMFICLLFVITDKFFKPTKQLGLQKIDAEKEKLNCIDSYNVSVQRFEVSRRNKHWFLLDFVKKS